MEGILSVSVPEDAHSRTHLYVPTWKESTSHKSCSIYHWCISARLQYLVSVGIMTKCKVMWVWGEVLMKMKIGWTEQVHCHLKLMGGTPIGYRVQGGSKAEVKAASSWFIGAVD